MKHSNRFANNIKSEENIKSNNNINLPIIESNTNRSSTQSKKINNVPNNFKYINENVHGQLMRAFLNFNPMINLTNLNETLARADPEMIVYRDNLKGTIDKHLKEVLDPLRYRKHYLKVSKIGEKLRLSKKTTINPDAFNTNKLKYNHNHNNSSNNYNNNVNFFHKVTKQNKVINNNLPGKKIAKSKEKQDCKIFYINLIIIYILLI
jgi:hypothetical protein